MRSSVYLRRLGVSPGNAFERRVENEEIYPGELAFHNKYSEKAVSEIEEVRKLHFGSERADDRDKHYDYRNAVKELFKPEIVFRDSVRHNYFGRHRENGKPYGVNNRVEEHIPEIRVTRRSGNRDHKHLDRVGIVVKSPAPVWIFVSRKSEKIVVEISFGFERVYKPETENEYHRQNVNGHDNVQNNLKRVHFTFYF